VLLVVDNDSTYTKNLIDFLSNKKINFSNVNHKNLKPIQISQFTSFILSGRHANDKKMNAMNSRIIKHAVTEKKSLSR